MATHLERRIHSPSADKKSGINKKFMAATLAGAIALGGGFAIYQAAQEENTPQPTPAGGIVNPNNTDSPNKPSPENTQTVVEGPLPTEKTELSMEQQAANAVFDYWLNLLNKTQEVEPGFDSKYYLKTQIYNLGEWQHNIDIIKNGGKSDSELQVVWIGGETFPKDRFNTPDEYMGIKSQGGMTLKDLSIQPEPHAITNGDKSQGITWNGNAVIDFLWSGSENEYWPADGTPTASLETLENWIYKYEADPYWPSSPWERFHFVVPVINKDGQWIVSSGDLLNQDFQGGDPVNYVLEPLPYMGEPYLCQNPSISSSCQLIQRPLNY